jgi:methyl-accepting chemotaxis protein
MEVTSTPSGMLPQAALSGVVPLDDGFMTRLLDAMHALQHGDYGVRLPSARTGLEGKVADAFNEMALRTERRVRDDETCSRQLLDAMGAFRNGDFSARMEATGTGIAGKLADAFNDIATVSERRAREAARVSHAVGKQGKLKQRMAVPGAVGGWADEIAAINTLIDDLVWPTTEVTRAVGAVAKGDLSQSMGLEVDGRPLEGEFLRSAKLVNSMIDQLSVFTSEVTRVAREVGTEG